HTSEETPLDVGTAFHNAELRDVCDANCVLDAALPEATTPADAVREADVHFASHESIAGRWVMNPSAPAERTRPLAEHLIAIGYQAAVAEILYLSHMPTTAIQEVGGLKIIPARASSRHA